MSVNISVAIVGRHSKQEKMYINTNDMFMMVLLEKNRNMIVIHVPGFFVQDVLYLLMNYWSMVKKVAYVASIVVKYLLLMTN